LDNDLEQHLLGVLLKKPSLLEKTELLPQHFYDPIHQAILSGMFDVLNKNLIVDSFVLKENNNNLDLKYLIGLESSVVSTENFEHYESSLISLWKNRTSYLLLHESKNELLNAENVEEVLTKLNEDISNVLVEKKQELSKLDKLNSFLENLEQRDGKLKGADTGFTDLNRMIKGLVSKKMIVLGARPSVGKSAFALNLGKNVAEKDVCAVFSLEMPNEEVTERVISNITNISSDKFEKAKISFNNDDWQSVSNALNWIHKSGLHIYDEANITVPQIRYKMKQLKKDNPGKKVVCIIDYLQLITAVKPKGNRQEEVSEISRQLKLMAMELDINVIALSQLSRSVEQRQDKRPMLSDLRESGSIEQDADVVAFLYRDDYYNKETENKNIVEVIIAKNRSGSLGTIQLAFIKEFSKFVNLERRF
jgi:replicative DNA helicase